MLKEPNSLSISRKRLSAVLRASKEVVSIDTTAKTLELDRHRAAKLLSGWSSQGWLRRVGPGLYIPIPIDLAGSEQVLEDPWVMVPALFSPCYIGGWTAAHHWELTEQLFNETLVFTTKRVAEKHVAQGTVFNLHSTSEKRLFGLTKLWRGSTRVNISDPARTLIDMIAMPDTGGGIGHVTECLKTYLLRENGDRKILLEYADQYGNGIVFKRLGFLADNCLNDHELSNACKLGLTAGYGKLDPSLKCNKLVTAWRLWIPAGWNANLE